MLELDSSLVKTIDYQAIKLKNLKVEIELKKVVMNYPNCEQCTVKTNGTKIVKVKHSAIASELNISIPSVIDQFYKNVPMQSNNLPFALSIGEVYLGRKSGKKCAVVLMDFLSCDLIELIYGRSVGDCMRGLQLNSSDERLTFKCISTDMYSEFHRLAKSYFPRAEICVDSLHVINLINESFQKLLISKMKSYDNNSKEYYLLKKKRYLLLKNKDLIDWFNRTYDRKLKYYISKI